MQPPLVREVIVLLEREGWLLARSKGGRRIYKKDSRVVTLHGANNDRLKKGTWAEIKREAGW